MNTPALIAVIVLGGALLGIFGSLYRGAWINYRKGQLDFEGIKLLRWALAGHVTLYILLGITAFLT